MLLKVWYSFEAKVLSFDRRLGLKQVCREPRAQVAFIPPSFPQVLDCLDMIIALVRNKSFCSNCSANVAEGRCHCEMMGEALAPLGWVEETEG